MASSEVSPINECAGYFDTGLGVLLPVVGRDCCVAEIDSTSDSLFVLGKARMSAVRSINMRQKSHIHAGTAHVACRVQSAVAPMAVRRGNESASRCLCA